MHTDHITVEAEKGHAIMNYGKPEIYGAFDSTSIDTLFLMEENPSRVIPRRMTSAGLAGDELAIETARRGEDTSDQRL